MLDGLPAENPSLIKNQNRKLKHGEIIHMNSNNIIIRFLKFYRKSIFSKNKLLKPIRKIIYKLIVEIFSLIPKNEIRSINGIKMYLDYNKKYGSIARYFGYHELENKEFFQNIIEENDIVFDIGAYQGDYSLVAAKKVGKNGRVYAFEPSPDRIELLQKNIELNSFFNIEVIPVACLDRNGTTNFSNSEGKCLLSNENKKSMLVETVTIDNFSDSRKIQPNVIKIDAEGSELLILNGMKKTLLHDVILFVEIHPLLLTNGAEDVYVIFNLLESYGFTIFDLQLSSVINEKNKEQALNKDQETQHIIASKNKAIFENMKRK